jgi:hypothetical protein
VKLEKKTTKLLGIGVLCIALVVGLFLMIRSRQLNTELSRGFPLLLPGAYVGTVEFTAGNQQQTSSLYVERLRDGNTLLFVIFLKDFQPQTIFSQKISPTPSGQSERFRPVTLIWKEQKLVLSGKEESGFFKGIVKIDGDNSGNWNIRRMTPEETVSASLAGEEEKILLWLKAKERLRKNIIEKSILSQELVETTKKVETLDEALGDKQLLQLRSEQRRKELEAEFAQLKSEREKSTSEMESLVNSLDLLTRITKRGQAVSLERKILQRENRWYTVHWQGDEDSDVLTEEESGIDMAKLDSAVRKARETKSFLREKEDEIQKIRELSDELNNPQSPIETPEGLDSPEASPEKPAEEKDKLWDRLFG